MMMLENVIETTENCRYCLMCRHVAPVGHVTNEEVLTPHGIALTVASQRRGMIEWDDEAVGVIYSEVDGGNSRAHCVTKQPFEEAIAAVRVEVVEGGYAPPAVYELHQKIKDWHSPYGENGVASTHEQGEIALFVGDEATHLRPSVIDAAVKLLESIGMSPVLIGHGRNNGFMAASLGFPETAKKQAQTIMDQFEATGADTLVVLSAGDYFTFTQLYPERLGINWNAEIRVIELSTLLAQQLEQDAIAFRQADFQAPFAYVDPTHAVRVKQRFDHVRNLTHAVMPGKGLELFWRRERAHPVGSTALQFVQPEVAEKLTRARLADASQTGAEIIVCEDPATLHHLERYANEYHLQVLGLYELLGEYLVS